MHGSSRVACLMGLFLGHPVMRVGDIRPAFKGSVECKTLYHAFQSTAQIRLKEKRGDQIHLFSFLTKNMTNPYGNVEIEVSSALSVLKGSNG